MKSEICECGHVKRIHLTNGRCLHEERNQRMEKIKCPCKKFKAKSEICECGHKEDWHSRSTNRCHKCPCEKFKNSAFYCCKCQDFFKEPHNHSPPSNEDKEPDVNAIAESSKSAPSGSETLSDKRKQHDTITCDGYYDERTPAKVGVWG